MKRSLRERLQMYQLVHDLVENNQSVWEGIPKYALTVEQFSVKFNQLKEMMNEHQLQYSVGIKQMRDQHRTELIANAVTISKGLKSYAFVENDALMADVSKISASSLRSLSQVSLLLTVERILHHAQMLTSELESYGISSDLISGLKEKRDDLALGYLAPRKAIIKRKQMGEMIQDLFKEIDGITKLSLDNLTAILAHSQPEYVKSYTNARKVLSVVYHRSSSEQSPPQPDDGI